jgi:hypothetical protein
MIDFLKEQWRLLMSTRSTTRLIEFRQCLSTPGLPYAGRVDDRVEHWPRRTPAL